MAWVLISDLISLLQDFMDFIISKQRVLYCKTQTNCIKQYYLQEHHSFIFGYFNFGNFHPKLAMWQLVKYKHQFPSAYPVYELHTPN